MNVLFNIRRNENDKKKAASAKNKNVKEVYEVCKCANCGNFKTKHGEKCCFLPGKSRSEPLIKSACLSKRCNDIRCEMGASEKWGEFNTDLVTYLLLNYPVLLYQTEHEKRIEKLVKKLAVTFPTYRINDMLIPNWVARETHNKESMVYKTMTAGFKYDPNDKVLMNVIVNSFKVKVGITNTESLPTHWTKHFEQVDKDFAYSLTVAVFFKVTKHTPNISKNK